MFSDALCYVSLIALIILHSTAFAEPPKTAAELGIMQGYIWINPTSRVVIVNFHLFQYRLILNLV